MTRIFIQYTQVKNSFKNYIIFFQLIFGIKFIKFYGNRNLSLICFAWNMNQIKKYFKYMLEKAEQDLGTEEIKKKHLNQISMQIRNKIWNLQNPPIEECAKRLKVLCRLRLGAGLASD
jgi:hypothetical protein